MIIAMLIGLISTWYGHNVALRVRSISSFSMDDSHWDWEGFRLKNIWIRRTVSWKIACILAPHSTLAVNFILSSMNFNVFGRLVGGGEINK